MRSFIYRLAALCPAFLLIFALAGCPDPSVNPDPEEKTYGDVTFKIDGSHCDAEGETGFYPGATLSLLADNAVKIWYSTDIELTEENFQEEISSENSSVTLYEAPVELSLTHNHEQITFYAVAQSSDGEITALGKETLTCLPTYRPNDGNENNYPLDGSITEVIDAIKDAIKAGTDVANIDLTTLNSETGRMVSGFVTMVKENGDDDYIIIQDSKAAIEIYGEIESTDFYPGQFVSLSPTKGQYYNENYEISAYTDLQTNAANDIDCVYYKNLGTLTDFSGLEDGFTLYGIKTDAKAYNDYTVTPQAYISDTYNEVHSLFGYISYNNTLNAADFTVMDERAAFVIGNDTEADVTPTIDRVYVNSSAVKSPELLELKCFTPDSSIYYTTNGTDPTSKDLYPAGCQGLDLEPGQYTVKAYSEKNGVKSDTQTFSVMIMGVNDEYTVWADYGLANATDLTALTGDNALKTESETVEFEFDAGGNTYPPKYYNSGKTMRLYNNNTFTLNSGRTIESVLIYWQKGYEAANTTKNPKTFTASEESGGEYDYDTHIWTGSTKHLTFTAGGSIRITSLVITYSDADFTSSEVEMTYKADEESEAKTAGNGNVYLVTEGTVVSLAVPEDFDAEIYYSTEKELDYSNAKTDGAKYESAIEITEDTTISAVLVSGAEGEEQYSRGITARFVIDSESTFADRKVSLSDGDEIYIYEAQSSVVLGTAAASNGSFLEGLDAEVYDDCTKLKVTSEMKALKVLKTINDQYMFYYEQDDGEGNTVKKYLTASLGKTSSVLKLVELDETAEDYDKYSVWDLYKIDEDGNYLISNTCNSISKYLEYYQSFKAYTSTQEAALNGENFCLKFFSVTE